MTINPGRAYPVDISRQQDKTAAPPSLPENCTTERTSTNVLTAPLETLVLERKKGLATPDEITCAHVIPILFCPLLSAA